MVKEDYVSYKVARLLQEKGFDEVCFACYEYFISGVTLYQGWMFEYKGESVRNTDERVKCPTLQMAMKWLREVHKWSIQVFPVFDNLKWCYDIYELKKQKYHSRPDLMSNKDYDTYEQTAEAAIKYCLTNLI